MTYQDEGRTFARCFQPGVQVIDDFINRLHRYWRLVALAVTSVIVATHPREAGYLRLNRFRRAESDIITQNIDPVGVRAFSASLKVSDRLGDGRNKFRAGKSLFDSYARNHGEGMMTGLKQHLLTLPGLGMALLPKAICPFCLPVYFNFLTSLGLGFLPSSKYLFRITFVLLLTAVSTLAFRTKQR